MVYHNPLHPPVGLAHISTYNSLAGAVDDTAPRFPIPYRQPLPQQPYVPSSKWTRGMADSRIPLGYHLLGTNGDGRTGTSMAELSARSPPALLGIVSGGETKPFVGQAKKNITLHILWPGYEKVEWSRSLAVGPDTTLAFLASEFAKTFSRFVEINKFAYCERPEFQIAQPGRWGICFNQLVLLAVYEPFPDHWQADVAYDLPH